jgi:hypothetical protein
MARRKDVSTSRRIKCTLCLSPETSGKLSLEAARRRIDRSALAEELLSRGLRHIVVSYRREAGETEAA